ncbi:MAG TPA: ABC transporter substrate-binding protein [Nitrospinota bacterium]|nr:ABC transporter substrate-binding protein [Nitrospinota bacterium]
MRKIRQAGIFTLAVVLMFATSAVALEKMTYSMGWLIYGRDLGWLVARDKGYYKAEGLDVNIVRGYGGSDTAKKLGAGSYEIAGVVAVSVIFGRLAGVPLKIIGMQHDKAPFVIRTVEGRGINRPKDIEGRKFGTPAGDATWVNMPAFARINGIDLKKVKVINTSPSSRGPALIAGAFDASTGFITEYPFLSRAAAKKGLKIKEFLLADYGLEAYAFGPATTGKMIKERGDVVRKFMRASVKGFAAAIRNPKEGLDFLLKQEPSHNRQIQKEVWFIALTTTLTPDQKRLGIFRMTDAKWKKTRGMIAKVKPKAAKIPLSDLYTNEFLPKTPVPEFPQEMKDYLKRVGRPL